LKKNHVEKILETLKNTFPFEKNIEISLESTPQNLTKENLEDWKKL
jgi:coproporphyrinogen III oxidase-like Fe-S oxidoreductase